MWIDTHCHPFDKRFEGEVDAMLERARAAGVSKMISVGYNPEANRSSLKIAEKYDDVYTTLGVHPCDCRFLDEEIDWMRGVAKENDKVVAVGETGLDYHHMSYPKEEQERVFRAQIQLAKELGLPLVVHSRDAAEDTLRVLLDEGAEKVIYHCYPYDYEYAKKVWGQGWFTAFGGIITYPKSHEVQEAAQRGPLDLMLVETDCPYLPPQSHRGKRNEVAYVVEAGEKLAELRGISADEVAEKTTANAIGLFWN